MGKKLILRVLGVLTLSLLPYFAQATPLSELASLSENKKSHKKSLSKIHPGIKKFINQKDSGLYPFSQKFKFLKQKNHVNFLQLHAKLNKKTQNFLIIEERLKNLNIKIEKKFLKSNIIQIQVPINQIQELEKLNFISKVFSPSFATKRYDTTYRRLEGDLIQGSNTIRSQYKFYGEGIKIGVISNGIAGLEESVNEGILPEGNNLSCGSSSNITCQTFHSEGITANSEGTAMLEIIHDIAPDADLYFVNVENSLSFIEAVQYLSTQVDIIVDDIGFFSEPYFKDGPVAKSVEQATSNGVIFVSAAGNEAANHVSEEFTDKNQNSFHDFSGSVNDGFLIRLNGATTLTTHLQWNNLNTVTDDYDLFICFVDSNYRLIYQNDEPYCYSSDDDNINFTKVARESLSVEYSGNTVAYAKVLIKHYTGDAITDQIKLFFFTSSSLNKNDFDYYNPEGSIFGHPAVSQVIAVGAVDSSDNNNDTVQFFSSQGPAIVNGVSRNKPDLVATDGISVSGNGNFVTPFFGTSAAAPNVAGCIALMMNANPDLNHSQIVTALFESARDIEDYGFDFISGHGHLDCEAAVELAMTMEPSEESISYDSQMNENDMSHISASLDSNNSLEESQIEKSVSDFFSGASASCSLVSQNSFTNYNSIILFVILSGFFCFFRFLSMDLFKKE